MVVREDGVFWFVDGPGGAHDPLHGLDQQYRYRLETTYNHYCGSVRSKQLHLQCCGVDLTTVSLDEGKSMGNWSGAPRRLKYGQRIRGNQQYKNVVKNERNNAREALRNSISKFREDLKRLVAAAIKNKAYEPMRRQTVDLFTEQYRRAWAAGRRASGVFKIMKRVPTPNQEEEQWFRGAVREELSFWNSFIDEIEQDKGDLSGRKYGVEERIDMYVDSIWFMYHTGRVSGFPDTVLMHWYPKEKKKGFMCLGCQYMVAHSPFPRDLMPTVPRGGDTPCLMRCVHRVVVRFVTPSEVEQRREELPSKEAMLRALRRIMAGKVKKPRGRSRTYNPWLGNKTWGELR